MPVKRRARDEEYDEEEEVEERPRRRRRPRDEDEEREERPRRRRARDDDDDEEERPRRRKSRARDDDDDDDRPRRKGKGAKKAAVRKGWDGAQETQERSSGGFPDEMKITDKASLVKFLEDEPFISYTQHWINNPPGDIRKKSWICLGDDDCPLCDLGDRPAGRTAFNVLHISTGAAPKVKILVLGNKALGQVRGFAEDPKTGPLTKLYYAISRSGKNKSTAWNFRPVKERDLDEDWDIDDEDLDEILDAIEDAELHDEESILIPTKAQLQEIAEGLMDEDDEDDD